MIRFKLKQLIADHEFRTGKRLMMIDLAAATGISRITLSQIANHRGISVRTAVLDRLCAYFGCPLESLAEYVADEHVPHAGTPKLGGQKKASPADPVR